MAAHNGFRSPLLPYSPLPTNAFEAVRDAVMDLGFPSEAIMTDYSFSIKQGQASADLTTNALVFAHPIHRTPADYSALTIFNSSNGAHDEDLVPVLAHTSAPFHLLHHEHDRRYSFYASTVVQDSHVRPIRFEVGIAYDQLRSVLHAFANDLRPQRIIDVKRGKEEFIHPALRDVRPLQLSFWAQKATGPLLKMHFQHAVETLRQHRRGDGTAMEDSDVIQIATQLLGAVILADTGVLGTALRLEREGTPWSTVIGAAQDRFERYFRLELLERYPNAVEQAYFLLTRMRYSGFVPDMLADLYTAAYSEEQRKQWGGYDTPLYLTRYILNNIPVEYLPPDQRILADMTCGWGSFLIAGHERLMSLSDMAGVQMRDYIHGNDKFPFTALLAGVAMLVSTSEDSWDIRNEDAQDWPWLRHHRPNVIVGNPPFGGSRKESRTDIKQRYQHADNFLRHAVNRLAPNGYLAMLMPRSFVEAQASADLRRLLLEHCDIYELWELPPRVFSASVRTLAIFAHKRASSLAPVRVRTVQPRMLGEFKNSPSRNAPTFSESNVVPYQATELLTHGNAVSANQRHRLSYHLALDESAWQAIQSHCRQLKAYIHVFQGAILKQHPTRSVPEHFVDWLPDARTVVTRQFCINYDQKEQVSYPEDFRRPRKKNRQLLAGIKVLLTAISDPSWGQRTEVAIERRGCYVPHNFFVIVPTLQAQRIGINHEVVAAVLSWFVSNAWVIDHLRTTYIRKEVVETLPFPHRLTPKACQVLTDAVRALEVAAYADDPEPEAAVQAIDDVLTQAYGLDATTLARLRMIAGGQVSPVGAVSSQILADWPIDGIVESVDPATRTITLWLEGFDKLQTVQIDAMMPGWMLRPQAAFRTKIPRECDRLRDLKGVQWGKFEPQVYTYLNEDELFGALFALHDTDERSRVQT